MHIQLDNKFDICLLNKQINMDTVFRHYWPGLSMLRLYFFYFIWCCVRAFWSIFILLLSFVFFRQSLRYIIDHSSFSFGNHFPGSFVSIFFLYSSDPLRHESLQWTKQIQNVYIIHILYMEACDMLSKHIPNIMGFQLFFIAIAES